MTDIAPELLKRIQDDFQKQMENDDIIAELAKRLEAGTAKHTEAYRYADRVGAILAEAYRKNLHTDSLPDGRFWYNIANRVITPTMQNNYNIIESYVSDVQADLNKAAGIGIKPVKPELNTDRMEGIVNKVSDSDNFDNVSWVLDGPIKNFSQSIVDDSIKENVSFHGKAGMRPKIVRKSSGKCCDWCNALAGVYYYPDVPRDVYRRHDNCNCTVEYDPGDGKVKSIHSGQEGKRTYIQDKYGGYKKSKETNRWQSADISDKINSTGKLKYHRNYARADGYLEYADVVPKPKITPDEIIDNLEISPIGKETLEYIQHTGIKPKLIYTPRYDGIRGDQLGNEIRIFMSNISDSTEAAQTIIHEVTHLRYNIGGCQWAEAVCMANEKKHITGRNNLTTDELRYIVNLARNAYPEYQWKRGGYNGNKRF